MPRKRTRIQPEEVSPPLEQQHKELFPENGGGVFESIWLAQPNPKQYVQTYVTYDAFAPAPSSVQSD